MTDGIPSAPENTRYVLTDSANRTEVIFSEASYYTFNRICVAKGRVEISPKEMLTLSHIPAPER